MGCSKESLVLSCVRCSIMGRSRRSDRSRRAAPLKYLSMQQRHHQQQAMALDRSMHALPTPFSRHAAVGRSGRWIDCSLDPKWAISDNREIDGSARLDRDDSKQHDDDAHAARLLHSLCSPVCCCGHAMYMLMNQPHPSTGQGQLRAEASDSPDLAVGANSTQAEGVTAVVGKGVARASSSPHQPPHTSSTSTSSWELPSLHI